MPAIRCRALTDFEVNQVANALPRVRDRALFVLGVCTGFRIAELVQIKVRDVWQYGKPAKTLTVTKANMKGQQASRTVSLSDLAQTAIASLMESNLAYNGFLFRSREGGSISECQFRHILKATFDQLRLEGPLSTHSMRKTFANKIYQASEKDLYLTQLALGHKSIDSTAKYLQVAENATQNLVLNLKFG